MTQNFEIPVEPDWPHDKFASRYAMSVGSEPNKLLIASALTPPTKHGREDLTARLVMHFLLYRLNIAQVRQNYIKNPKFGRYRYTWLKLEEFATNTGLSFDQVKRGMDTLVGGGIVYATRATRSEPRSYRLTDPAFLMFHGLQYPVTKAKWLSHNMDDLAQEKDSAGFYVKADWIAKLDTLIKDYPKCFPSILEALRSSFHEWHNSDKTDQAFFGELVQSMESQYEEFLKPA